MYTPKPIIWFDPNRIQLEVVKHYWGRPEWMAMIPGLPLGAPIGTLTPRYPSPDELFRWEHRVKP